MAVQCQFIHSARPQRAAVMIYALVFAITAAVTLYVASTIYQTRQKASALRAYNEQKTLLIWDFQHILRGSYQNSLEMGFGLADIEAWNSFNGGYNYVGWSGTTAQGDIDAGKIGDDLFANFSGYANALWIKTAGIDFKRYQSSYLGTLGDELPTASNKMDMSALVAPRPGNEFTTSDIFTVPGWKPRRFAPTVTADVNTAEPIELSGRFIRFSDQLFPDALRWRSDLPFDNTPYVMNAPFQMSQTGLVRWVRDSLTGTMEPQNAAIKTLMTQADPSADPLKKGKTDVVGYTWAVEEPITNYQLLLLDPLGGSGWSNANISGSIRVVDATLGSNINRAKILMWGNVEGTIPNMVDTAQLTGTIKNTTNKIMPLAMVVNGSVDPGLSDNFEWRVAKKATQLSFGRTSRVGQPGYLSTLGAFLADMGNDYYNIISAEYERRLEISNAQASIQRAQRYLATGAVDRSTFCYLNSVLSMSEGGLLQWSAQSALSANNNRMGPSRQLPYTSGTGQDYWVYKADGTTLYDPAVPAEQNSQILLRYGDATGTGDITQALLPYQTYDNKATSNGLGVSGIHYKEIVPKQVTVINLDLAKLGMEELKAKGDSNNPAYTSAWESPIEVNIYNADITNHALYVRIKGDASLNAGNKAPVRIVVQGASDIRLVPDTAPFTPGVGNYRRFILTSPDTATMDLTLETATASDYRWYGVVIAPFGLNINAYSGMNPSGSTWLIGNSQAARLIWQGTMLVRSRLQVSSGILELRPDDGDGTSVGSATASTSTYNAFVPKYNNKIPIGRPVPMMVPRMVWTFE